jgi:hypothetical protein
MKKAAALSILVVVVQLAAVVIAVCCIVSPMTKRLRRPSKPYRRKPASKKSSRSSPPSHVSTRGLYGWITHTEVASSDPTTTKTSCAEFLGWTFKPGFPMPGGEYHLFAYSDNGGRHHRRRTRTWRISDRLLGSVVKGIRTAGSGLRFTCRLTRARS